MFLYYIPLLGLMTLSSGAHLCLPPGHNVAERQKMHLTALHWICFKVDALLSAQYGQFCCLTVF